MRTMTRKMILGTVLIISSFGIFLAACDVGANSQVVNNTNAASVVVSETNSANTVASDSAFKVDFKTEPGQIQAGAPATLVFTVRDDKN